jgi:hypothetical protein
MELILTLNGFIAFYVSGVAMSYWKLYFPAMSLLKAINKNNKALDYKWVTVIVWGIGAAVSLPFLIPAILFDSVGERFIIGYVKTLNEKEEE